MGKTPEGAVALFRLARGPSGARTYESPKRVTQAFYSGDLFVRLLPQATIDLLGLARGPCGAQTCVSPERVPQAFYGGDLFVRLLSQAIIYRRRTV